MNNKDKIILCDKETKFEIESFPKQVEKIVPKEFNIILFADNQLDGCFFRDGARTIPLNKVENNCYVVHSQIFNNIYYPMENFNENYKLDFRDTFIRILHKLGATKYNISYSDEEEFKTSKKNKNSGGFYAKYSANDEEESKTSKKNKNNGEFSEKHSTLGQVNGNANIEYEDSHHNKIRNKVDINVELSKNIITPEEFQNWIKKENINLDVFKSLNLTAFIETFFDKGKLDKTKLEKKSVKLEYVIDIHNKCKKICVGFKKIPVHLGHITGGFNFDFSKYSTTQKKIAEKMKIVIEF